MPETLHCFKAYDIRGKLGEELNPDIAYRIGRAYGEYLQPKTVVIGADIRLSSEALKQALADGLMDAGADVLDLGVTGTEEVYFATFFLNVDGGIEITASHNPKDYNGMKLVRAGSQPISGDSGLREIQHLAQENRFSPVRRRGTYRRHHLLPDYISHILSYIDTRQLTPLKLVVNAGNGAAGHVIDAIEAQFKADQVPVEFIKIHHEADGNFPNGVPNPLLPECRACTAEAVRAHEAHMGIAWDGDFDRCFLFDENGRFIEGYYIVGLLSEAFVKKQPGAKIIHDPRLTWNTIDIVNTHGGRPVQSKTGHAFIKERMRLEDAVYGGEMSAHHYFRHFAYCDSGMIPWLLVAELLCTTGKTLSAMVDARIDAYPASGEINCQLAQPEATIQHVLDTYQSQAIETDFTDGISLSFSNWRFNLRLSNTEPVVRLNVESKADVHLMQQKTAELLALLRGT
ncbi:phosphomannomutase CpsG [Photobacterium sp. MCCC 1A19761]|uniref:phosphomannomutase CpsG n=1 Tax=Photobacterium sp. MCCC 1A19761 TaxID=3115000 RepID=UPI00307E7442